MEMKSSYAYRRDRVLMIIMFLFSSIMFGGCVVALDYLRDVLFFGFFIKSGILFMPMFMILSCMGIIADSFLIKEIEKGEYQCRKQ